MTIWSEVETGERSLDQLVIPQTTWSKAARWLGLAIFFLLFANGRHPIAIAAWLAPACLLVFTRQRVRGGMWAAWLVLASTWAFQFRGMAPLPPVGYALLSATYGLALFLPFRLDHWLAPRIKGFRATLILPCSWVAVEYLVSTFTPYGSWGAAAYSQHEQLALIQLVSVTGIYGLSFLIAWTASVSSWAWDRGPASAEARRGVSVLVGVLAAVIFFGNARLALVAPASPTVRVASLSKPDIELFSDSDAAERAFRGAATEADLAELRERANRINEDLLRRSEREARAGASLVFWGETNGFVLKEDEPRLFERAAELASAHEIYLGLGLAAWNQASDKPLENKLVLIDPAGNILFETWKAIPIPGGEAAISARDDGRLKSSETPFGRVAGMICFDMDFPGLVKQAGKQGVDIMLVPSNDWSEIDPWHTHMARFRAIEQGFNLVRHVSNGLSVATDSQGRLLASMDHFTTTDRALISHLPTRGERTVYSTIGDTFAWLCMLGLGGLTIVALRSGRRTRAAGVEGAPTASTVEESV